MMFRNGEIPHDRLVRTDSGRNSDGYWEHLWPEATLARWRALVADVFKNEGVLLYVTPGWNAYRPLNIQHDAKRKHGPNAAAPGYSSHGGFYNGRDTMAVDVANWGQVGKDKFYAYARKHGFIPGEFSWEPWHIIDPNPWAAPAGGGATPIRTGFLMALSDAEQSRLLAQTDAIYKALFGPNNGATGTTQPLRWSDVDGVAKRATYGLLDIAIETQVQVKRGASKGA